MFREWRERDQWVAALPIWLNPTLSERLNLRERFEANRRPVGSSHTIRPIAYTNLQAPLWQRYFRTLQPGHTKQPLEIPTTLNMDVRLLQMFLRLPAIPWCRRQLLLRYALAGRVPKAVIERPKSPLSRNPDRELASVRGLPIGPERSRLSGYGSLAKLTEELPKSLATFAMDLRLIALNNWLQSLDRHHINTKQRGQHHHDSSGHNSLQTA